MRYELAELAVYELAVQKKWSSMKSKSNYKNYFFINNVAPC